MDDMIADIGMEYDLGSGDQHPPLEVQNFYRPLAVSDESARWHQVDCTACCNKSYGDKIKV
jgi:hypothetical protein